MQLRRTLTLGMLVGCLLTSGSARAEEDWKGDWLFKAQPEGSVPLAAPGNAWKDMQRKLVILDGEICLREGPLEMFACPRSTKEHESIVVVDALPSLVHQGLIAVGVQPGKPATFQPEYRPASGPTIKIVVAYVDKDGKRHAHAAQDWIKNSKTGKKMEENWVFSGGHSRKNDQGKLDYSGDQGDFICVANFPTATFDIPIKSSQMNDALVFEALTDAIPAVKTKVRLVLVPQLASGEKK